MANYHVLETPEQLQTVLGADLSKLSVLYFRAEWAEVCKAECDAKFREIAARHSNAIFLEVEAESLPDVSESFDVASVPYFVLLRGHTLLLRIEGAKLDRLEKAVAEHAAGPRGRYEALSRTDQKPEAPPTSVPSAQRNGNVKMIDGDEEEDEEEESEEEVFARCRQVMAQSPVVLFMKGDPTTPRCGFSQQTVRILKEQAVDFTTYDILTDEGVRQGMKKLNSWPTFPQLVIHGELVGGLDILKEMVQTGELKEVLSG